MTDTLEVANISLSDVVDKLATRLGEKEREIATLEAAVEVQARQIADLKAQLATHHNIQLEEGERA